MLDYRKVNTFLYLFMYLTCNNWPQEIDDAFHTRSTPSFPAKEMRPILLILGEEHLTGLNSNTCRRWRYQVLVCICSIYMYYSMYKNKFLWYPEFPACSFLNLWLHGWSHHCAEGPDERLAICHSGRASWLAQIFSRAKYDYINWNITIKHVCSTNIYSFVYIICIYIYLYLFIFIFVSVYVSDLRLKIQKHLFVPTWLAHILSMGTPWPQWPQVRQYCIAGGAGSS